MPALQQRLRSLRSIPTAIKPVQAAADWETACVDDAGEFPARHPASNAGAGDEVQRRSASGE
jgi:hypothetical protein